MNPLFAAGLALAVAVPAFEAPAQTADPAPSAAAADLRALRQQLDALRNDYEARLQSLEARLRAAEAGPSGAAASVPATAPSIAVAAPAPVAAPAGGGGANAFNPALSLIPFTRTAVTKSTTKTASRLMTARLWFCNLDSTAGSPTFPTFVSPFV